MELELAEDEMTLLDDVNTFPPEYPGWMLAVPGAGRLGALDRPVWDNLLQSKNNCSALL
jgi:hypothetical protein